MIKHDLKLIFIHINKTAGSSVESAFGEPTQDHRLPVEIIRDIGLELYNRYYKFTIVRNPWDRYVSMYHYRILHGLESSNTTFKQFVINNIESPEMGRRCQFDWITQNNNLMVDFIARFENLDADFKKVCDRVNYWVKLPHINKTDHLHYSFYYDKELLDLTTKAWEKDLNYFNYKFRYINHL